MHEPHDPNRTVDGPSAARADSLDAGLAAGFGKPAQPPRSSLDASRRPVLLKEAQGESDHVVRPNSDAMPDREQTGDRYQLFGEIARGGMGAVLRGRDVDLGRDLAVKVLLEKHANRPEVARRFVEEAQIGGQLQHPGVVPVYDVGHFGDRPFFTMKLVKGKTLTAILGERADASTDRPRLLGIALQVTQALAYAHAKGVIHRDLKPANVMVGAFGEVQVMDWGLAKVLAEGGVADEERASRQHQPEEGTLIRTARSSGTSHGTDTEAGSLLGTPAYMPPEQANGDVANLDRRADVFGLGAILCEILTGKPPYVGRSAEEVRRKSANGDLADARARLDACGADAELIVLTKACLSPEAIDRPKDAQAVADALTAYLNGVQERLQTAQRERAVAVAREAEQRKRRKVQLALAVAVLALIVGSGAFAFWRNEQVRAGRERDARNAEAVAALLGQAEEALRADDATRAAVSLEAAKKRSAEGGAEKEAKRLEQLDADLTLLRDLDAVDQFRWTVIDDKLPDPATVAARIREALGQFGVDLEVGSVDDAVARVFASAMRDRIVSALDRVLRQEKTAGARAVLRRVDSDPYRDAVRDVVLANDRAKMEGLVSQKAALEQPARFAAFLGESEAIEVERRRQLLQAALIQRPGNLGLLFAMASPYLHKDPSLAHERLRWLQAAVAVAPSNYAAHFLLSMALLDKGQVGEAIACYRKAIDINPKHAFAHFGLGTALHVKGQVEQAVACFEKAIEVDPKFARAHYNLGILLHGKGQKEEAIACYRKAIEADPKHAFAHFNLGTALHAKGQVEQAVACFEKAIEINPKYSNAHYNLGIVLRGKGRVQEAIACYRKAIEFDPKHAPAHFNLGVLLSDKGQVKEAIDCYQKATIADPKFAQAHHNLGLALGRQGQMEEAIDCFEKAIEADPKLTPAHNNLGNALRIKGQFEKAITCYRKALEGDPKNALAHFGLGHSLHVQGQMEQAIACYRKAIEFDPTHAESHCNLGHALRSRGQFTDSLSAFRRGHERGTKQRGWSYPSAVWVREAERLAVLEGRLLAVLEGKLQPSDAAERVALAAICRPKKLHHAAARLYAGAFAADPKLAGDLQAGHRYNAACSAALAAAGQGADAEKLRQHDRLALRRQALTWLRADLTQWARLLASGDVGRSRVARILAHWQKDADLAGLRDKESLEKLTAEERQAFERLWADAAALLKKVASESK